jgi:hypothetical protein
MSTIQADYVMPANLSLPLMLQNMPPGYIVSSHVIREDRTIALNSYNNAFSTTPAYIFGGTIKKYRSDTDLVATFNGFACGFNEGNGGLGLVLNKNEWDYGVAYQYDGQWDGTNQTTLVLGSGYWPASLAAAGNHTIHFGQNYASVSTGSHFCANFNAIHPQNGITDNRLMGYTSTIHVYEIIPG